ncbi:2,3-bisphosphoglycerate-dependent phosphoglycerate mutase [Virgibacillus natechei]|uniref:2,3-bisphosphoglycerate-dependent phosphoglycerate mutase n=1 Tax=Virgibacillus natechei TaxID=1216297 RepID=A0ABS4IC38_9BACI|nr:histidine phosphatase family protein [Virgibacillus natechei]MBP1967926.1 2,3-bisphosphoglycerate-dependent phosphoglycerate mutase [Virgibacillus natechei]UZD14783.1 histidine phosphatase family protein [Virgibacillus natechei]
MKKIYFVRHCSADGQHKDSPLTTIGMRQAHLLSNFFSKENIAIDKIISSPYLRAIESIKPFATKSSSEIEIDDRLSERILSDEPIDDWIEVLEQSFNDHNFALPGGESAKDAIQRANTVLESIYSDDNIKNVIIVSHGNIMALLLQQYDGNFGFEKWKELQNPDIYLINYNTDTSTIECLWNA